MKKVALVLGSGGARGLAQIGAIQSIEEHGYEVSSIAGCSMGSVIGGVYAAGQLEKFTEWICNLDRFGVFSLMDFTFNSQGFIKGEKVFNEMKNFVRKNTIEDLPIPFTAVSVDIKKEQQVVFRSGDLFTAIRASVSIPSVLTPVAKGSALLVDGGVMNPLPLDLVKRTSNDILVAVDLNSNDPYDFSINQKENREEELVKEANKWKSAIENMFTEVFTSSKSEKEQKIGYYELLNGSFDLIQKQLTKIMLEQHKPDVLISVSKKAAETFDFFKAEELIAYCKHLTDKALDRYESEKG